MVPLSTLSFYNPVRSLQILESTAAEDAILNVEHTSQDAHESGQTSAPEKVGYY